MRNRTRITLTLALSLVALTAASWATRSGTLTPIDESRVEPRSAYGPIHATDAAVRAEIRALYDAERAALSAIDRELAELRAEITPETTFEERQAINTRALEIKGRHQRTHAEFGLEIARLNGDSRRAGDFERALDFFANPERYRPAPEPTSR